MSRNPRNAGLRTQTVPASCLFRFGLVDLHVVVPANRITKPCPKQKSKWRSQQKTTEANNPNRTI